MGQVRHRCATTTHAVRAAIQRSQATNAALSRELGINVTHELQTVAGFVAVSVTDILQMFRRCGTGPAYSLLKRARPAGQDEWIVFADPADRIEVTVADLLTMADEVQRFETDCDLLRRPASHIGSTARYDWDGMYISLIRRVHEDGVPETQAEWVGEVQEWFVDKSKSGEVPDERTIRRRLTPIWKALREPC